MLYIFVPYLLVTIYAANITANVNSIPMLNGTNFKSWKENVLLVLGCMDLDYAKRKERPASLTDESSTTDKLNFEKWERSNRLSLMMVKHNIPEAFRGGMFDDSDEVSVKDFLDKLEKHFAKNEKAETSKLLADLVQMRYKAKRNIRELWRCLTSLQNLRHLSLICLMTCLCIWSLSLFLHNTDNLL